MQPITKNKSTASNVSHSNSALDDPKVKLFLYYVKSPEHRGALLERLRDLGELTAFLEAESGTNQTT